MEQNITTINSSKKSKIKLPKLKISKSILFPFLAFVIPAFIMLIIYISIEIFPFGDKSLLTIDLYHQYIDYFAYFKQTFTSSNNFFYSFSKSLGGNMIGLFAYYVASPLNLIFLFFKQSHFSEAILIITLIKIGLSGLTFYIMCNKLFHEKNNLFTLIFSTCYALMAYNIVFQQNIMWLDGVIWLPIIVLGITQIVNENKFILYTFSLSIALFSNYYIGYMLCIFSVIFFIFYIIVNSQNIINKKAFFTKLGIYVGSSLLAAALAAIILLPTFISLQNGKATLDVTTLTLDSNFQFSQFIQKLFIGEMNIDILHQGLDTTLPDIFCGTITTALCFLFFFNNKISLKEKISSLIVMLILLMSFHIKALDLIWHGFNKPVGFLYRNSFIFSFFALYSGYKCFKNLDGLETGHYIASIFIMIALGIYVSEYSLESLSSFEIYLTIAFFIAYISILYIISKKKKSIILFIILLTFVTCELQISGYLTLEDLSHVSRSNYSFDIEDMQRAVTKISNIDDSFYRFDKTFRRSRNDGMQFAYNTLTHSSSTADFHVVDILTKFGFRNDSNIGNTYDDGSTLPINSLLNIKYVFDKENKNFKYFEKYSQVNGISILKNPYALPLVFKGNNDVLNVNQDYNPFEFQNQIFSALSQGDDVLSRLNATVKTENLYVTQNGQNNKYSKIDINAEGIIEFNFQAVNSEDIYAFFPTEPISSSTVQVYVNEMYIRDHLDSDHLTYYDIINLGSFEPNQNITVKFVLQNEQTNFEDYFFYALDFDSFLNSYNKLNSNAITFDVIKDNYIKINIDQPLNNDELIFTTIPYDKGWKAYKDGKQIDITTCFDTFIAIEATDGEIELKYTPVGFNIGRIISGLALVIIFILYYLTNNKKKYNI